MTFKMKVAMRTKEARQRWTKVPFKTEFDKAKKERRGRGVVDAWHIVGMITEDDMRKDVLKKEYGIASYDLLHLKRLISIIESMEENTIDYMKHEIFIPLEKGGPLIVHPNGSNNYYMLAHRVNERIIPPLT